MPEPNDNGSKVCTKCGQEKPKLAFAMRRQANDGLASQCRECTSTYNRKRNGIIIDEDLKNEEVWLHRTGQRGYRRRAIGGIYE